MARPHSVLLPLLAAACTLAACASSPPAGPTVVQVAEPSSVPPPPAPPPPPPPPPVPPMPKIGPIVDAPCRITRDKSPLGQALLRWHGVVFASFRDADTAELRIDKDAKNATMAIGTRDLELIGETEPKSVRISPREDALFGGFLHVEEAGWGRPPEGRADSAQLLVRLPRIVRPMRALDIVLPCEKLALGARPWRGRDNGKIVMFADGIDVPLRAKQGGEAVAQIVVQPVPKAPKPKPTPKHKPGALSSGVLAALSGISSETMMLTVVELERVKGEAHIQIFDETTTVEGWVPISAIKQQPPLGGGGFGIGRGHGRAKTLRCAGPVPIYLGRGNDLVLAGAYKENATIVLAPSAEGDRDDRRIVMLPKEVGQGFGRGAPLDAEGGSASVVSFVTANSIEGCREPPPDPPR